MSGRVKVPGAPVDGADEILTPAALAFVVDLHDRFALRLEHLLAERQRRQDMVSVGEQLDFLPETADIRTGDWRLARPIQRDPPNRPVDLSAWCSPTWPNLMRAQQNLRTGAFVLRPRGFHLPEKHLTIDGSPSVATLVDTGLAMFHAGGTGRVLDLPLLESHLEARLWTDLLRFAETALDLPAGAVRVIVSIDTVWAAFEMDELLHELRDRAIALAVSADDYLFSMVKTFRGAGTAFVLPERSALAAGSVPFLEALDDLVAITLDRRSIERQQERPVPERTVTGKDLLDVRSVPLTVTPEGLRSTIGIALEYLVNWLAGDGAPTIDGARVSAATAELCRSQLWQWRRNRVSLEGGRRITGHLIVTELDEATERLADSWAERPGGRELLAGARNLLYDGITALRFTDFITVPAYGLMP